MNPKYSIVIPTWLHLSDCLIPCCKSIIKHTDLSNVEVIVVANGCGNDGTREYVESLGHPFKLIWIEQQGGYAMPTNVGMKEAKGEYIILLNNDTKFLDGQPKNQWIEMLEAPFLKDANAGISAPMKTYCKNADADFLIYFCVMISRKVIDAIGYLDEAFFSYAEDTDHCLRAVNAGFKLYQVPSETNEYYEDKRMKGAFPIFHEGNVSHKDWKDGDKLLAKNGAILRERYNNKKRVTVGIPTKNRYDCLINTLLSIAMQSSKPHEIIIIDDSDKPVDLRTLPNYLYAFKLLDDKKIKWRILFGKKSGQHHSHQTIQELAEGDYIFRIDDDCIAEPTVIEELLSKMVEGVGAVAPLVLTPSASQIPVHAKNKITDMSAPNIQWFKWEGVELCDHLYSCYLYRKGVAKYDLTLSNKANREETIHSHLIKRAGYKLLVNAGAVVHHFRSEIGGIRSDNNIQDYDNDEKIFQSYLNEWNVQSDTKVCVIVGGIGDHYAYKNILPELRNRYKKIVVGACYPDVFFDEMDIELISIEDAKERFGSIDKFNIYRRMDEWNWKENITEAYKKLYL